MPYGQPKMMADIDRYAYGDSATGEYEKMLADAMGTFGGPAKPDVSGKVQTGAEGQLWQGIAAQQRAGQLAATRRGMDAGAMRAAYQAGGEMEGAGMLQAQAIRAAEEEQRRKAALAVMQGRSQYEQQMGQIGTQALGQALQQKEFEAQMQAAKEAADRERAEAAKTGVLGAAQGVLGLLASDERLKQDIETATGGSVDDLMATLGGTRKYVVSDEGNAAEFSGEYGSAENPRTALVYTGDRPVLPQYRAVPSGSQFDRDMAAFMAEKAAEEDAARKQAVMDMYDQAEEKGNAAAAQRRALDFSRSGIAITDIGEGGPPPEQRISYGTVIPRDEFRPVVPTREAMPVEARSFNQPFTTGPSAAERAEFVRRMTEGAEAARPATERALASMLGAPPRARVREATYEDAAKARRRQQLLDAMQSIGPAADSTMRGIRPVSYEYRPGAGQAAGPQFGVLAQDVERTPLGRGMVRETPSGKAIDVGKATGAILGMLGRVDQRLRQVEGK